MPVGDTSIAVAAERLIESRPDIVHEPQKHTGSLPKTITQLLSYIQGENTEKNVRERLNRRMDDRPRLLQNHPPRVRGRRCISSASRCSPIWREFPKGKAGAPMLATKFFGFHSALSGCISRAGRHTWNCFATGADVLRAFQNAFSEGYRNYCPIQPCARSTWVEMLRCVPVRDAGSGKKSFFPDYNTTGLTSLDFYTNRNYVFTTIMSFLRSAILWKSPFFIKALKIVLRYHNLAVSSVLTHEFVHTFQFMLEMPVYECDGSDNRWFRKRIPAGNRADDASMAKFCFGKVLRRGFCRNVRCGKRFPDPDGFFFRMSTAN